MDLDDAVARLRALRRVLDDTDGTSILEDLARSALVVVPSSLAVIVVLDSQSEPLAVVSQRYEHVHASVRSSLRLEFTSPRSNAENQRSHRMIFLAEETDAFTGFRALKVTDVPIAFAPKDLQHQLIGIAIDEDLEVIDSRLSNVVSRVGRSTGDVNRAVGFLIDRGYEPAEATRLLANRAQMWTLTLDEAAERILRSLD